MEAKDVRRKFTEFFTDRGHEAVPSASIIPHDATLLFTNSGMVPFKPFFQGTEKPPYSRATTVQKCVRAGGKHNDLDEVGRTARHLTFFEMMGNFSFGDYFKEDAIPFAWDLLTDTFGLPADKLWVTCHLTDDEAEEIWATKVGVPRERIQRLDEDNWWRMADTGPNGPCSEIFYDLGPEYGPDGGPANLEADARFVEIWNLVFMQFDQHADGTQVPLPKPSIDTGAGLERVLMVLQGVGSVWETDEFVKLLGRASELTGVADGADPKSDVSLRILADHARSTTFMINDGVFPSNEDRGYVLRRIMRRAIRHAYLLGRNEPTLAELVHTVVDLMGDDYPEIRDNVDNIAQIVEREEVRFRETIATGLSILDSEMASLDAGGTLPGRVAFTLHDTHGFPLELTQEIVEERGATVDVDGFTAAMAEQRERARADQKSKAGEVDVSTFVALADEHGPTEFVGRDQLTDVQATVLWVGDEGIVLDHTPFYAESGGQIGDIGTISGPHGVVDIVDTTHAVPGVTLHHATGAATALGVGDHVTASIDVDRRAAIRRNHTGTHLLHSALRRVLGDHVQQQGSWVGPDRLRFDFSHFEQVTPEQTREIEDMVNADVLGNSTTSHIEMSMDDAKAKGAIAFFGDKYGDQVRVLEAGPNSIELCGGTHVQALGDIGPLKIVSESSIGSNIRRVEAVTGTATIDMLRDEQAIVAQAADALGVPTDDVLEGLNRRLDDLANARKELDAMRRAAAVGRADELAADATDGVVVARIDDLDRDSLRDLAVAIRDKGVASVALGAALEGGGVALVAAVAEESPLHAGDWIADAAKLVGGGGKKAPDLSVAGGRDPEQLEAALDLIRAGAGITQ
ncbi:MAG: alanine--tRNA ligase [Acidimicrobiales bacterium]|nr:alanine--tRNA ligase [Acidimicrobiales bacterium]RZV48718.1 MAG: alanine--tRNA ligase [Acidimicrobiales bacterium]